MNRRLTRSRDAMVGGVAAGLAEWMNVDPALVRIAWALLVPLTAGAALLAYFVAWVVMPEAPSPTASAAAPERDTNAGAPAAEPARPEDGRTALLVGGGLVVLGLWFLLREYLPDINWGLVWPLLLVAAGAVILVTASRRRR